LTALEEEEFYKGTCSLLSTELGNFCSNVENQSDLYQYDASVEIKDDKFSIGNCVFCAQVVLKEILVHLFRKAFDSRLRCIWNSI